MTDRTQCIIVALDKDYRTDDVEAIVNAIRMIKGVLDAKFCIKESHDYMKNYAMKQQLLKEFYEKISKAFE